MSMARVRKRYGVPAKRGGRICYTGKGADKPEYGTITSTHGHHLRIRLDGHKHSHIFHPTWEIRYLEAAMSMVETVARAIHGAKMPGHNPDCLYEHHEWDKWPVDDRREYADPFTGQPACNCFTRHGVAMKMPPAPPLPRCRGAGGVSPSAS
jgi:hypothetical protein